MVRIALAAVVALSLCGCMQSEAPAGDGSTAAAPDSAAAAAPAAASADASALANDTDRTLYALGVALGGNLDEFSLTPDELALVVDGIHDVVLDEPFKVDMQVFGPKIQALANERQAKVAEAERQASAEFADSLAAEPGAQRFDSGLIYIPEVEGTGESPKATDTVKVHYHGTLRDGTVFDSSVDRGEPISFPLNGVIPCWTEGVQKMKVGGKAKLVCPAKIAYGDRGTGPIPGGATLLFEVQLLGIEKSDQQDNGQGGAQ